MVYTGALARWWGLGVDFSVYYVNSWDPAVWSP